jgi:NADH-quinone oxidoreductase subunit L
LDAKIAEVRRKPMTPDPLVLWLAIIAPFLAGLSSFILKKRSSYFLTLSSVLSLALLIPNLSIFLEGESYEVGSFIWWPLKSGAVSFGLIVDPLSILMGTIVTFISTLVFLYSIGYMEHKEGASRFWFFMGCFECSMLLLIFSDNLIMMLIGWEGVGLSSFFLISHYYDDPKEKWVGGPDGYTPFAKPSFCGLKALLTTGIADSFMLVGIFLLFTLYGSFNFIELQRLAGVTSVSPPLLLLASALIIIGPLGKSAQFPFQEWLPEAMAGPTPVSALLHSATMVKAGVYLVARLSIFYSLLGAVYPLASSTFFMIATALGLATVIIGSLYGCIAIEMKKILAYSTVSQLGYMFVALGIAGISGNPLLGMAAALFHLISHSIFKSSLFLSAGSIIHGTHTIYITEMGRLRKSMPKAFVAMTLATLSLAALPPFLGFWSKDAILAAVYPVNFIVGILLAAAAILTVFYSMRMIWYTFFGSPKEWLNLHREKTLIMVPPLLLAVLTFILGLFGPQIDLQLNEILRQWLHYEVGYTLGSSMAYISSLTVLIVGLSAAYLLYPRKNSAAKSLSTSLLSVAVFLRDRPFDKAYHSVSRGAIEASRKLYSFEMMLNQLTVALATGTIRLAKALSRYNSGDLNRYLTIAATFLLLLLLLILWVRAL